MNNIPRYPYPPPVPDRILTAIHKIEKCNQNIKNLRVLAENGHNVADLIDYEEKHIQLIISKLRDKILTPDEPTKKKENPTASSTVYMDMYPIAYILVGMMIGFIIGRYLYFILKP